MPLWMLAVVPVLDPRRWPGLLLKGAVILLGTISVAIGTLGATRYDGRYDAYVHTDMCYENLLRPGGGPVAFYLTDLLSELGLRQGPPTDLGPLPRDPFRPEDGETGRPLGRIPTVRGSTHGLLSEPVSKGCPGPAIDLSFECSEPAPGEPLKLKMRVQNPARPHTMNGWFLLEDVSGRMWNLQDGRLVPMESMRLRPWTGNSPLPYDVEVTLVLPLPSLPPGEQRLHFVLTDAVNTRVEGRGSAAFEVRP
jgi:hypothetical protein